MAGLTGSDLTYIAGSFGFTDSAGTEEKDVFGGRLFPLRRANSQRVLDCFLKDGVVYLSMSRNIGADVPSESTLLSGYKAESLEDLKSVVLPLIVSSWNELPADKTEATAEIRRRIGQDKYRKDLFELWDGTCALTGIDVPDLLVASHIVPWSDADNQDRLDKYNGFLFESRIDKLFDRHLITFADNGAIMISTSISQENRERLGIRHGMKLRKLYPENIYYLRQHRALFMKGLNKDDWRQQYKA